MLRIFWFLTYNKFKFRKWEKMSYEQRWEAFQKLEYIQSKKLHRPQCSVSFIEMDEHSKGLFVNRKNTIFLNKIFLTDDRMRFDGMFTLFHEGRHAFQHHVCFNKEDPGLFSRARKWKKNFMGYIKGNLDEYSFYSMQPLERDANKYALNRLSKFKPRFASDRFFMATLTYEQDEFFEDKARAKKELGIFYKWKVKRKQKENEKF